MIDLTIYGALALGRIGLQITTAHVERNKTYRWRGRYARAAIIVATFNEDEELFEKSIASLVLQSYPCEVIIIDDGSDNAGRLQKICKRWGAKYTLKENAGKREAMHLGFSLMHPATKYVLTADSDTIWHKDAALEMVKVLRSNPKIGGVTGFVDTYNKDVNWLTKIQNLRYWQAFNAERASQSLFGNITCISGPMGGYKREVIEAIKDKFISQTFLGSKCTFGDDRHLTNLVLGLGYKVKYSKAVCWTDTPTQFKVWLKQQTRWSKSYWRELLWQTKAIPKHGLFFFVDYLLNLAMPFLLGFGLVITVSALQGRALLLYALTIVLMSLVRIIDPVLTTKRPEFIWFLGYGFLSLIFLLPVKLYALATINDVRWGTRKLKEAIV
jgi:cellulose synthase/poly-beta-1,6-N-acetylglucosamine synthase-like glycosyltransferase